MNDDGPQIVRPVPRRPFELNFTTATLQDDDSMQEDRFSRSDSQQDIDISSFRFLNTLDRSESTPSLSRPQSFMNLTSSTLMGIYSEASSYTRDCYTNDVEDVDTPWGTGARTPIRRPSVDDATYELMRDRSHVHRHEPFVGYQSKGDTFTSSTAPDASISPTIRGIVLFVLGLGYGALVTRLHNEQNHMHQLPDESIMNPGNNWRYLVLWGLAGVALGSLLPWFDSVWEGLFGSDAESGASASSPSTDWALVMRAVGAFVGIIFAIRKLAWASTFQVAATLALVNPLLWWLIDRSKPGLVLSTAVGLTGSVLLLGFNPEIMPTPSVFHARNVSASLDIDPAVLGGLANQETVEVGVWMLSVLFCSCVCFGNIGRRLSWKRSSGRWGGIR